MRKYSRKDLKSVNSRSLGLFILIIFIIMTFSGCIGQNNEKILRIGNDFEPNYLDPARISRPAEHAIISNIYSYLIGFEPGTLNMVGDLAKTVPSIENGLITSDQRTITFELHSNAPWHPGVQGSSVSGKEYGYVTAHDVVYTIERLQGLHDLSLDEITYNDAFTKINRVEAINDYSVVFHLTQADMGFLWALAPYQNGVIVNRQAIEDFGAEYFKNPIGSGPFKFNHWTISKEIALTKHSDYYGTEPWLDKIIYVPIPDESVRYRALTLEQIDICSPVTLTDLWFKANGDPDVITVKKDGLNSAGLSFNFEWTATNGKKPLADIRVRKALAYATNNTEIVEIVFGGVHNDAVGLLSSNYFGSLWSKDDFPVDNNYTYNFTKARMLLIEAGYPDGLDLIFHSVNTPYLEAIPSLLSLQWSRANIRLTIVHEELSKWIERMLFDANYCVSWLLLNPRNTDPLDIFKNTLYSTAISNGLNYAKYSNPEIDALIDQASTTTNDDARSNIYKQIQQIIMSDLPIYPIWWETSVFMHQNTIQNAYLDLLSGGLGDWIEEIVIER